VTVGLLDAIGKRFPAGCRIFLANVTQHRPKEQLVTRFLTLLVAALLMGSLPGQAQQAAFPPDAARIVSSEPTVLLTWPGVASKAYRVDVFAGNTPVFSQPMVASSVRVPVAAGPLYQWQVHEITKSGEVSVVGARTFQVSNVLQLHFDGLDGAEGLPGGDGGTTGGYDGGAGGTGINGQDVTVSLAPANQDYVSVSVAGLRQERFLMPVTSAPIVVSATGGNGGSGGRGGDGVSGNVTQGYDAQGNPRYYVLGGGNGGNGGSGGSGGNGGNVVVQATGGIDAKRYVLATVQPGLGGRGGPGGRGGMAAVYTYPGSVDSPGTAVAGRDGSLGSDGQPGRPGTVSYR